MALSLCGRVSKNILYNSCDTDNLPLTGIEEKGIMINRKDIDLTALTKNGASCTNLSLISGATGVELQWLKNLSNTSSEFAANEGGVDMFTHKFVGRVHVSDAHSAEFMRELADSEVVMVVETKWKGEGLKSAYKIYGLQSGMRLSTAAHTTLENGAGMTFEVSSVEGFGEIFPWIVFDEGSYSANKARFDSKFA